MTQKHFVLTFDMDDPRKVFLGRYKDGQIELVKLVSKEEAGHVIRFLENHSGTTIFKKEKK